MAVRSVELIIDNKRADFESADALALRVFIRSFDLSEIDKKGGNYTLNLNIPRTKNNNEIVGFVGFDQPKPFAKAQQLPCVLRSDGAQVMKGVFSIKKVEKNRFVCDFIGDNVSWADLLKNKRLNEIQSFPKIAYSGTRGTNYKPWPDNEPDTATLWELWNEDDELVNGFNLPLVSYGNFPAPSDSPFANAQGIRGQFILWNQPDYPLDWSAFKPAPFERAIVKAMFADAGYEVSGNYFSRVDFENTNLPYRSEDNEEPNWNWGLLARFSADYGLSSVNFSNPVCFPAVTDDQYLLCSVQSSIGSNVIPAGVGQSIIWNFDQIGWNNYNLFDISTDRFNALRDAIYRFRLQISVQGGGISGASVTILKNGIAPIYVETKPAAPSIPFSIDEQFQLVFGDYIQILVTITGASILTPQTVPAILEINQVEEQGLIYGQTIQYGPTPFDLVYFIKANLYTQPALQSITQDYRENYTYTTTYIRDSVDIYGNRLLQTYRVPASGYYKAKFSCENISSYDGSNYIAMVVVRSSDDYGGDFGLGLWDPSTNEFSSQVKSVLNLTGSTQSFNIFADGFFAQKDDTVELVFGMLSAGGIRVLSGSDWSFYCYPITDVNEAQAQFPDARPEDLDAYVLPYYLSADLVLPKTTQIEFLSAVLRTYNLFLYVNEKTKTVSINTRDAYFMPSGQSVDWSGKTSLKDATADLQSNFNVARFELLRDEDDLAFTDSRFETDVVKVLGGTLPKQSDKVIETYYAPTVNRLYKVTNGLSVYLPTMYGATELSATLVDLDEGNVIPSFKYLMRVAKWQGLRVFDRERPLYVEEEAYSDVFPALGGQFVIPVCYFDDPYAPYTDSEVFTFSDRQVGSTTLRGLYQRFYDIYVSRLAEQVRVNLEVYLTPADIADLDPRRPVRIGSQLFYVNLVDGYNPMTDDVTKVELVKV